MNFFQQVYQLVRQIPEGRVTTYGEIARSLATRDLPRVDEYLQVKAGARTVGWALHASAQGRSASGGNPLPICPCHRVVTKDGQLSESYAFGGSFEQYAKLKEEGVTFLDRTHVNLAKHQFKFEILSTKS